MHTRQRSEVAGDTLPLLINRLKENDWWLRSAHAFKVCESAGIEFKENSYYRDIKAWLPDVQWGPEATPTCPSCLSDQLVQSHGFQNNNFGRRIIGLDTHYYAISRRYICRSFEGVAKVSKSAAAGAAAVAHAAAHAAMSNDSDDEVGAVCALTSNCSP